VVSGGGTGIGRAVALRFASEGHPVVILGRRADVLDAAAAELTGATGTPVRALAADLAEPDQVEIVAAAVAEPVRVLVANAGGSRVGDFPDGLAGLRDEWVATFRANVLTAVLLTRALERRLVSPGGRIVLLSSIAAMRGGGDAYSAAKAALHGWVFQLATELGPRGITANVVAPGYVAQTEFFGDRMTEERAKRNIDQTLLGKAGQPEDVAGAIAYLAGPDGAHVTGQILQVNGGALLGR
jgi:3-oxoacyl-[acyl-carrier protein] reductase